MHWSFWLVLFIVFVIIEVSTVQLVSIWFAIGSIGAGIVSIVTDGQNATYEFIAFAALTAAALLITRPFVKKVTHTDPVPTNADSLIGQVAVVSEDINNVAATGAVAVRGAVWSARLEAGEAGVIPAGTEVEILSIDGVKLIVKARIQED